jgi:MFS family permease
VIRPPLTPTFRRLWCADAVSVVGDAMAATTLLLWVYSVGHRGAWVSAVVLAGYLPPVLTGPLLGRLADRVDRRRLMVSIDWTRCALGLALAGFVHYGHPIAALACLAAMSGAGQIFSAAQYALLPGTVPVESLPRANGIMSLTTQASFVVGPALAVVVMSRGGPTVAVLVDAATFAGSALLLAGLRGRVPSPAAGDERSAPGSVRPALRAIAADRTLLVAVAAALLVTVSAGVNNTVMVLYLDRDLGGHPSDVAWLSAANGVAQIAAGAAVVAFARRLPVNRSLAGSLAAMALCSFGLAGAPVVLVAIVAVVGSSMANAPFNISYATVRQTRTPEGLVGRLFAVTGAAASGGFLAGSLGGGWLADVTSARVSVLVSTGFLCAAALLAAPLWQRAAPPAAGTPAMEAAGEAA